MKRIKGFTLIEVLVSMSLGMILVGVAWNSYSDISGVVERGTAMNSLSRTANIIYTKLQKDLEVMQQHCAWHASYIDDPKTYSFTFAKQNSTNMSHFIKNGKTYLKETHNDYSNSTTGPYSYPTRTISELGHHRNIQMNRDDIHWCKWYWCDGKLYRAENTRHGRSYMRPALEYSGGITPTGIAVDGDDIQADFSYKAENFAINALPRRDRTRNMDDNSHETGLLGDMGDESDLAKNLFLISANVADFKLEWINHKGDAVSEEDIENISGVFMDGRTINFLKGVSNTISYNIEDRDAFPILYRPVMVRVSFTLTQKIASEYNNNGSSDNEISMDYNFSIKLPGIIPMSEIEP